FSPCILAPIDAVLAVPADLDARSAVLVEPFAAALHAVDVVTRAPRRRIAVLGLGRLGLLIVAALAASRTRRGTGFEILALGPRSRGPTARGRGAWPRARARARPPRPAGGGTRRVDGRDHRARPRRHHVALR